MFLVPWMMIYAISAFLIHHKEWFGEGIQPKWKAYREIDFDPDPAFPRDSEDQAQMILEHLDLDGAHSRTWHQRDSDGSHLRARFDTASTCSQNTCEQHRPPSRTYDETKTDSVVDNRDSATSCDIS
jgi:hypothetical protein